MTLNAACTEKINIFLYIFLSCFLTQISLNQDTFTWDAMCYLVLWEIEQNWVCLKREQISVSGKWQLRFFWAHWQIFVLFLKKIINTSFWSVSQKKAYLVSFCFSIKCILIYESFALKNQSKILMKNITFFAVWYSKSFFYVKWIKRNEAQLEGITIFYLVLKKVFKILNVPS